MSPVLRTIGAVVLGAVAGLAYQRFVGCRTGACPITSNPYVSEAERKHVGNARFRFEVGDAAALPLEPGSADLALVLITVGRKA